MLRGISDVFREIESQLTGERITFQELLEAVHERGFGFLLLIFSFPMALPFPVPPGINILLATPLIILTAQQMVGRRTIWMPEWVLRKSIKQDLLRKIIHASIPWFERIEKLVRPRLEFITLGIFSHLIGAIGLIMALTVCVPLPMTNTVPSLSIALMSVGVITRDGLCVITGAIIGVIWVCALVAIIAFLGVEGFAILKDMIKSLI